VYFKSFHRPARIISEHKESKIEQNLVSTISVSQEAGQESSLRISAAAPRTAPLLSEIPDGSILTVF
jgi:hypothetical protein